ncbi:MAG: hypothetical protein Q8R81_12050 [Novosphingobium sp.]|uniref:hypothetical protein n=1 Tax=Novosphingobium sp. TaxID=1874826 RepID=UPI0027363DF3|nr:hypothetical protein [Novosphingobium sp.]MDP3551113.1 hypothetical protein [Novosphingobium sp.]
MRIVPFASFCVIVLPHSQYLWGARFQDDVERYFPEAQTLGARVCQMTMIVVHVHFAGCRCDPEGRREAKRHVLEDIERRKNEDIATSLNEYTGIS